METHKPQLNIKLVLDISTAHVRKESTEWLDQHASMSNKHGWLVSVFYCLYGDNETPPEIKAIAEVCEKRGIYDIHFDCDGFEYEVFEKFDW